MCLGSFVNALIWRLKHNRDWVTGRSECSHCHHPLAWNDLIPVVSWLSLRGKCRYCQKPIEDTPLAEVIVPLVFIVSYLSWPYAFDTLGTSLFALWLVIVVGCVAMMIYDLRWMVLPDKLTITFTIVSLVHVLTHAILAREISVILNAGAGVIVTFCLFYGLFQFSKGKWIGGGDVKLSILLGLLTGGIIQSLLLIFLASTLGTIIATPLIILKKRNLQTRLPFGPLLIVALFVVVLYGQRMVEWYEQLLII